MALRDNLDDDAIKDIIRRIRILENGAPVGFTAITRGQLRVASNEGLLVQGSAKVEGWLVVTGTANVVGTLQGSGAIIWSGPASFSGDTDIGGTLNVGASAHFTGNTTIGGSLVVNGAAQLNSDLVLAGGRIVGGGMVIQSGQIAFIGGGVIQESGGSFLISPSSAVLIDGDLIVTDTALIQGGLNVDGHIAADSLTVSGAKSFLMPHPTKPGMLLRHGSTESPVSGIEYWGDVELDLNGTAVVELPEYFEALAKPENRTVFVTGRGFAADWTDIADGQFTITGTAGRRASWLVKAERFGGDFALETVAPSADE